MKNDFWAKLAKMQTKHWVAFLLLIVFGASLIFISKRIKDPNSELHFMLHELGILFVTIVPMILIYERILRNSFLSEMGEKMNDVIKENIPESIERIRESGLCDVTGKLRYETVLKQLDQTSNAKFRILKIWIPSFELLHDALLDAIVKRQCEVEILLLHPHCTEAIEKRSKAYNQDLSRVQSHITNNLRDLMELYRQLPAEYKNKLTVKLHRDFISLSLLGVDNTFYAGLYLHGRVATEGTQLRVKGKGTPFYTELYKHFKYQWKNAEVVDLADPLAIENVMSTNLLPDIIFPDALIKK